MPAIILLLLVIAQGAFAEQQADLTGIPEITAPTYSANTGPRVAIDAAHHNFHTAQGRYRPFAMLLEADGYRVSSWQQQFSSVALKEVDVLVIANALPAAQAANWTAPSASAFTAEEIKELSNWVNNGGSLLLIADHMPFPAAAAELARAFGFLLYDGYLLDKTRKEQQGLVTFSLQDGSLQAHPIVNGVDGRAGIDSVTTFLGQAFLAPHQAQALLELGRRHYLFFPQLPGKIGKKTTQISAETWLQGATLEFGKGRLAVFGEAAAFTTQINSSGNKVGMNHSLGQNNAAFLLNTLYWLHPSS